MRFPTSLLLFILVGALACIDPLPIQSATCDDANNVWLIEEDLLVVGYFNISIGAQVNVTGSFIQLPNATLFLGPSSDVSDQPASLNVSGLAFLSGAINVTLNSRPPNGKEVLRLTAALPLDGDFQSTGVNQAYENTQCDSVQVLQDIVTDDINGIATLVVSLSVQDLCPPVDNTPIIPAATVAGLFVAAVIVAWAAALITRTS